MRGRQIDNVRTMCTRHFREHTALPMVQGWLVSTTRMGNNMKTWHACPVRPAESEREGDNMVDQRAGPGKRRARGTKRTPRNFFRHQVLRDNLTPPSALHASIEKKSEELVHSEAIPEFSIGYSPQAIMENSEYCTKAITITARRWRTIGELPRNSGNMK